MELRPERDSLPSRYSSQDQTQNVGLRSAEHVGKVAIKQPVRMLPAENYSPPFELIAACSAKSVNLMLAFLGGPLAHDDAEVVQTPRTLSRDVPSDNFGPATIVRFQSGHLFSEGVHSVG